jgi:predicted RNA-binding protein YlxR (DUF448 family)
MMMNTSPKAVKRRPQRTCIACNKRKDKQELVRLVRTAENCLEVDTSGKKAGRGAYLCPNEECWNTGINGSRLEYSLRTKFSEDDKKRLMELARDILKERVGDQGR